MKRRALAALLAALALAQGPPAAAFYSKRTAGAAGADFLKIHADARSAGMGGAVAAAADDASAPFWNPAALAGVRRRALTATHGFYFREVFYDFIGYAQSIRRETELQSGFARQEGPDWGALGVTLLYLNAGGVSAVDKTGNATGERFAPQDVAVQFAWGAAYGRFDAGFGFKFIRTSLLDSASAMAGDVGVRAHFLTRTQHPLTLAVSARNLGTELDFGGGEGSPLPMEVRFGAAYWVNYQFLLALDAVAPKDNDPYAAAGAEYTYPIRRDLAAVVRGGYHLRGSASNLETLAGLTLGFGMIYQTTSIDYAWEPVGLLGDIHRFGMSWRF